MTDIDPHHEPITGDQVVTDILDDELDDDDQLRTEILTGDLDQETVHHRGAPPASSTADLEERRSVAGLEPIGDDAD